MKKRLTIILTALTIITIGVAVSKFPALANSDIEINSTGSLDLEGGDVVFDVEDIEDVKTQVKTLYDDLPDGSYAFSKEGTLKTELNSKGIINYDSGKVIFDASDLIKLANGIDNLKTCYQAEVVKYLKNIHTYYRTDGSVTHVESDAISSEDASNLTFSQICNGILKSQSLDHLAGENILPASADNLSEGSAAWVDGNIVIGTGNDNKANYDQGYEKGCEDTQKANSAGQCYYLGYIMAYDPNVSLYCCDVKLMAPEVDYTKLSRANFIICPTKVNYCSEKGPATSNGNPYCTIYEGMLEVSDCYYEQENGYLYFDLPTISARGGIASGVTKGISTKVSVSVYLVTGEIIGL